jgi:hypothetical protein
MILMVSYDLKGPAGSYKPLFEFLQKQGPWWHYLKSTWLISTEKTPDQLNMELKPYMQKPDLILITRLGPPYQGWLPKDAWDWINKNVGANLFSKVGS